MFSRFTKTRSSGATASSPFVPVRRRLSVAACVGDLEELKVLLKGKTSKRLVDVNAWGPGSATALFRAAEHGHYNCVSYLVKRGADINRGCKATQQTPLHAAVASNHAHIVEYLISHGARLTIRDNKGNNVLDTATLPLKEEEECATMSKHEEANACRFHRSRKQIQELLSEQMRVHRTQLEKFNGK